MTSSIKPHVQKHYHAAREEPSHGHRYHAQKFGEDRTFSSEDMITDRKTHTHTHTHTRTRARGHTHTQTDRHSNRKTPLPHRGRSNKHGSVATLTYSKCACAKMCDSGGGHLSGALAVSRLICPTVWHLHPGTCAPRIPALPSKPWRTSSFWT